MLIMFRGKYRISFLPDLLKICLSCAVSAVLFLLFKNSLGVWPAAVLFAIVYAALALSFKLVSVSTLKDMLLPREAD